MTKPSVTTFFPLQPALYTGVQRDRTMTNSLRGCGEFSTRRTIVDEFRAILMARELARRVNSTVIPAAVEAYAEEFGAVIRPQWDLERTEPGWSFESDGKHYICINANDAPERQRFTICHEIA